MANATSAPTSATSSAPDGAPAHTAPGGLGEDLSALSWVRDELRRSLEAANKALRRYLKEQAQRGELDSVDPSVLRQARNQLHQCVGVLELVGLGPAAELPRAAEAALQRISARPKLITPAAVDALERGSFALLDFIERRLAGKPVSALALFPQYKALQELAGALRVHPADLWQVPWAWRDLPPDTSVPARQPDADTTGQIEADLLALMRGAAPGVAARMSALFAGLAGGAQALADQGDAAAFAPHSRLATLWQLAAGFFEAQADGLLQPDAYSKRLGSKLLAQLRAGDAAEPSERLAHDLLFFCSQAAVDAAHPAGPRLAVVRQGYGLTQARPVAYDSASLGRYDPAWVAQARKRVAAAKEVWSAVAGGDLARRDGLPEQFALVSDSLARLYPDGAVLGRALQVASAHTLAAGAEPPADLAMEVATALLYLDASIEDGDFDHPESAQRVQRLAQRIDAVRQARDPGTLDLWMEELYRRVSDRQTMGSVVQELRASLSEVEKNIDQYFRNPAQRDVLIPVPAQLQAMRGVLSVLGLDQASLAVLRMRDDVDELANTEVNPQQAIQSGSFDRLADNLGALSFLIDMVSVQPQMAKSLFRFDPATGNLAAVMAREDRPSGFAEFDPKASGGSNGLPDTDALAVTLEFDRIVSQARSSQRGGMPLPALGATPTPPALGNHGLPMLSLDLGKEGDTVPGVASPGPDLRLPDLADAPTLRPAPAHEPTIVMPTRAMGSLPADPVPPAAAVAAPPPAAPVSSGLEDDPEMREIFLEEADEVLANAGEALAALQVRHDDTDAMTTVRRAFHTLKGSARMVGLLEFGDAAWACEQLYNTRLAEHAGADADLRGFSQDACAQFGRWVQALRDGNVAGHGPLPIVRAADALRTERRRLALDGSPVATAAAPDHILPPEPVAAATPPVAAPDLTPEAPAADDLALDDLTLDDLVLDDLALEDLAPDAGQAGDADAVAASPTPADATLDLRLRVPDLPLASDLDLRAPPVLPPAAPDALPLPEIDLADLDDAVDAPPPASADLPAPDKLPPAAATAPMDLLPDATELDLAQDFDATFGLADVPPAGAQADGADMPTELAPLPDPVPEPAAAPVAVAAAEPDAERFKQIGPLRIGIPLFNIYLNEADELSRKLGQELAEWALEQHRPVGEAAVALAHSLAGSSGTVGYADLSQLARALEHALERTQARGQGRGDESALFTQASDEIRRLLHLFAAGFLNAPDPDLVARLQALAQAAPEALPAPDTAAAPLDAAPAPTAVAEAAPVAEAEPEPAPEAEPEPEPVAEVADVAEVPAADPLPAEAAQAAFGRAALLPFTPLAEHTDLPQRAVRADADGLLSGFDDDIDAVDAVDDDLLQIFSEEAQELLPALHAGLRDWARQPGDAQAPSSCMRCLHTFKGSARLAGAMRLGEMAHRLESLVEQLAGAGASAARADIEALAGHADVLQARLDGLLAAEAAPAAVPAPARPAAPVAAPAAPPATQAAAPVAPSAATLPPAARAPAAATAPVQPIDWQRFAQPAAAADAAPASASAAGVAGSVRVRTPLLDRLVNQAGEVSIARARIESDVHQFKAALGDLTDNLERLRAQLRDIELQAETQIDTRMEAARAAAQAFDPLELDRFTRFQELTRMMAESVADVATVQRGLQRTLQSTEDALAHQARMNRDMQDDLLRTRMVEFEGLSERLYRVVRQAAKETGKPVRLDIVGGGVEIDRGVLDRMTPAFEHLLRNSVVHGIEPAADRAKAGKDATGTITLAVTQVGNEVGVEVRDDGAGLNLPRILARGRALGLVAADARPDDAALANLIFEPGFTTAESLTGLAGRGVGMDVVRTDVNAMGGRIETASAPGQGSSFRLVLPLTTAVTQVVMLRCGERAFAVPSTLIEIVRRIKLPDLAEAYRAGSFTEGGQQLPFLWFDGLLGGSARGSTTGEAGSRSAPVVVIRSAQQRVVLHVDEVLGNQEVVVKNLGPQLSRVPGLVGMTLLPSGLPALIYNPVALATLYGETARAATVAALGGGSQADALPAQPLAPLVLVVDDSLTVRRITQRLLEREGYRVAVAKDGLDGLDKLAAERPVVLLTDIEMPRMDGFDLVRNMRTDARLAGLPVIMITSRIAQKHRDYAAELGVDHYLGKPYAEDELLALVARYARAPLAAAA